MILKTLSQVDFTNKRELQMYEDYMRERMGKLGYRIIKRSSSQDVQPSGDKCKGFRIVLLNTDDVVAGENYDLSLADVETFWLARYNEKNAGKAEERSRKRLKKMNAIQLDGGWIVTNDARTLQALKDHVSRYGNFDADGHGAGGDIASVMYRAYRPWFCPDFSRVWPLDGDWHNLTDVNLQSDVDKTMLLDGVVPITKQRRIWHNDLRIALKLPDYDQLFFTVYTPEMLRILCNETQLKSWYIYKKHLYCRIHGKIIAFADVIALFDAGKISMKDIAGSILEGKRWMQENKLETDHLRNNPGNNCPHSVAIMPKEKNGGKSDMLTKISKPFAFVAVRIGEDFRVLLGKFGTPDEYYRYIVCRGVDQFLDCLEKFYEIAKASGEMLPVPEDPGMTRCISQMLQDDGEEYHGEQYNAIEGLLRAKESIFTLWNGDVLLLKSIGK